jgi:hypothetical protein
MNNFIFKVMVWVPEEAAKEVVRLQLVITSWQAALL